VIVGFIFFMAGYGRLIIPWGFQSISTAKAVAWLNAIWMAFAYALWNLAISGKPLWPTRAGPKTEPYQHVREESHTPPSLPSVRDLSDDLNDFYS
jgi:hypothetical protein